MKATPKNAAPSQYFFLSAATDIPNDTNAKTKTNKCLKFGDWTKTGARNISEKARAISPMNLSVALYSNRATPRSGNPMYITANAINIPPAISNIDLDSLLDSSVLGILSS